MPGLPTDYARQTCDAKQVPTFNFDNHPVDVMEENGELWFIAKQVCGALGVAHHDAVARLDADERGSVKVDTLGGKQLTATINESGLYSLILRSRKPEAKRFKRWVTHEVLPTIRRTGRYEVAPAQQALAAADDYLALAREAGVTPACLASVARWRAGVAVGKTLHMPCLRFPPKPKAIEAPVDPLEGLLAAVAAGQLPARGIVNGRPIVVLCSSMLPATVHATALMSPKGVLVVRINRDEASRVCAGEKAARDWLVKVLTNGVEEQRALAA